MPNTALAVFDDGSKKMSVAELFALSSATRCIVQSLLRLPASNDEDTLLLLPSLFVGSAAALRSLVQVRSPLPSPLVQLREQIKTDYLL